MVPLPHVSALSRDRNEARRPPGAIYQCIVCGSWIKGNPKAWVHVHGGGLEVIRESEYEAWEGMYDGADLGLHPVGSSCIRKYPQLREYLQTI
jgi:hypothetical protein